MYFPTHEASITLTPDTQRRQQKRKPQTNVISLMNTGAKVLNKILPNQMQQDVRRVRDHDKVDLLQKH